VRTRIKFCGLVRPDDVDTAVALGVDAVGFVFYPKSPRYVTVCRLRAEVGLDVVQFHGDEPPALCIEAAGDDPWWRAVRMRAPGDLLESERVYCGAEALLVDSFHAGYGGSGKSFDWSWLPAERAMPLILSGGLDPRSVGVAIDQVAPVAVDVSSGIQGADPRTKDRELMEGFAAAVMAADARRAAQFQHTPNTP
jgi:phosphoribosylanthranilate isomerase